jgi:hypothetical protein
VPLIANQSKVHTTVNQFVEDLIAPRHKSKACVLRNRQYLAAEDGGKDGRRIVGGCDSK